jgi:hypothetical protein
MDEPGRITANVPQFNIKVGNFEASRDFKEDFDEIINISDNYSENATYWIPINEVAPWTYTPFYAFKKIVDKLTEQKKRILVHCHAGAHRSKMMVFTWLLSKGFSIEDASKALGLVPHDYEFDTSMGYMPNDLMDLYRLMDSNPTWSLSGCLLSMGEEQLITNTSPKGT